MADPSDNRNTNWQGSADAMERWAARFEATANRSTALLIEKSGIGPGSRVLDLGAGTGSETVRIAGIVGARGYVLATDISPDMVATATAKIERAGLTNAEARIADAEKLDLPASGFDAAICRMGLMLFRDPDAALRGMRAALRPGGRLAAMVFSIPERNPMQAVPDAIIRKRLGIAPPGPGDAHSFSLAAPGLLKSKMERAGFADVEVVKLPSEMRLESMAETIALLRERMGGVRALMARADEAAQADIWREIETAMAPFEKDGGICLPQEFVIASAARPAGDN